MTNTNPSHQSPPNENTETTVVPNTPTEEAQGAVVPNVPTEEAKDAVVPNEPTEEAHIHELVEEIGHHLPAQHPLDYFIHHNTLHAFEDFTFQEAIERANQSFETHSLRKEADYFADFQTGRITLNDIDAILQLSPAQTSDPIGISAYLRTPTLWKRLILQHGLQPPSLGALSWRLLEQGELQRYPQRLPNEIKERHTEQFQTRWNQFARQGDLKERIHYLTAETHPEDAQQLLSTYYRISPQKTEDIDAWVYEEPEHFALTSLWLRCLKWSRKHSLLPIPPSPFQRHRDVLLAQEGEDLDNKTHPILLRFLSRFCDQGMSFQPMPDRDQGILRTFVAIYDRSLTPMERWLEKMVVTLRTYLEKSYSPEKIIALALQGLQVAPEDQEHYLSSVIFSLRGWMGMIRMLEQRPDYLVHPAETTSLLQAVALHITAEWAAWSEEIIERPTCAWMAKPWKDVRCFLPTPQREILLDAYFLFQCCLYAGISTDEFAHASEEQLQHINQNIAAFDENERSWIWHLAYERNYYQRILDGLRENIAQNDTLPPQTQRPSFQIACCIDDREESFRRHLEEIDPQCETFGVAGFFGIDMRYKGLQDPYYRALCPPVLFPKNKVGERPQPHPEKQHQPLEELLRKRRFLGWLQRQSFVNSRMPLRGFFWTLVLGLLNFIPMLLRILAPRKTKELEQSLKKSFLPTIQTEMTILKSDNADALETEGFTHDELLARVQGILRVMGLTSHFAPIILITGHGSSSRNNPHKAAYDCGACGGAQGGPNARIFAATLNTPSIREALRTQADIHIPEDTWFIGCMHDTTADSVEYYELDKLPPSLQERFQHIRATVDEARRRNAHERCRRFESFPLHLAPAAALEHVEERSSDISEPRPECGHATNAICLVGRRHLSRNLYLDRRSFLVSYNPSQDPEIKSLTAILGAVVPVCAGINLEYFFSYVNNAYYGAGTKLPHNISGYVGVINGNLSDLQAGLPWQMVEIHEPVRLLMIVEQSPALFARVMANLPYVAKLINNQWLRVVLIDPDTRDFFFWEQEQAVPWTPPVFPLKQAAESSVWYRGKRGHLLPARILASLGEPHDPNTCQDCEEHPPIHAPLSPTTSHSPDASATQTEGV